MTRHEIAESLLGAALVGEFAPCPGRAHHTKGDGPRDFRVILEGVPTGYCFHGSCSGEVESFNKELRRRIWLAENGGRPSVEQTMGLGVKPEPRRNAPKRPPLDLAMLEQVGRVSPAVDEAWLRSRSAVDPVGLSSGEFLEALYEEDERVLVFTRQFSQGDFLWWHSGAPDLTGQRREGGGYRLSQERGTKATASALPVSAPEGVWFLAQPVTGQWALNARLDAGGASKFSRRSEESVTAWRFFVLENDEAPMDLWLRALAALPLPIAAIYTSGGRSVHALVRWEQPSKRAWDLARDTIVRPMMCPLGADPAALTAVRLTRLPGCKRGDREQRLLYLNPRPAACEILHLKEIR